jgi:protein gp37
VPRAIAVKRGLGVKRLFLSMEPLLGHVFLSRYLQTGAVDLVIVGGESGRNARAMPAYWVDGIKDSCVNHLVPFHFKQQSQADYPRTYAQPETFHPRHQIREHFA